MNRLPPREGEWIDRTKSIGFQFEGRGYSAFQGDCPSSALWAGGARVLGRSFKYHRPRSVYSLANHDVNVVLTDGREPNIRGDVGTIAEGADYRAVNTFGGVESDAGRFVEWLSPFMPVGFYYKAFFSPRRLFPWWERKMRAMAGLGSIRKDLGRIRTPKSYSFCDVLVVGAGPAGLSAALAAGEAGAKVIVVDENPHPGGSLGYQWAQEKGSASLLQDLVGKIKALTNVDLRLATQAAGYYADHWVALVDDRRMSKARAGAVVFATGCHEQPAVFRNNDLPGVMLASGAQRLIFRYRVKPFERAVVLTCNPEGHRAAQDLKDAGVDVVAIVDLERGETVYETIPGPGKRGIRGVVVCPLDEKGVPRPDDGRRIDCDGVAVSVGWAPADSLFCQSGGRMAYSETLQQFLPAAIPPGIHVAGRMNGVYELKDQIADGHGAGQAAARGKPAPAPRRDAVAHSHPYPVFEHPKSREFVDLDEDVQIKDLKNAIQEGYDNVELLKRYSTFGMGPSQGKIANTNSVRILNRVLGRRLTEGGGPTSRPFYHPVALSHLGGRGFDPHRHTALHGWHQARGAVFMPAGTWVRPAYYPAANRNREHSIREEVEAVRTGLGMIDVGTLGKIEVHGRDAGEFLERLYTARFARMKIGTTRYAVMCDEAGVVIDDGVVGRLSEECYYATSTTTGAEGVYREMQRWAILWNLQVVLVNVTGTYGALNVAGPHSRTLLSRLTDIAVDETSFPYLGCREGKVAGVPARVLRVGFVGELGFEIHMPATCGPHVWDALMKEGADFGIRPFGVEAQRILRLEKGHVIVGQDTDGLSSPFEADLDWAVKLDKPFFVGQRTLSILKKRPLKRKLVGFMLPVGHEGPVPMECHLVIRNGEITGRVTSIADSPALQRILGLAYVAPDQAEPGTPFRIRAEGGREVEATVTKYPFYDPAGARQKGAS